jgi:hypothetical protein
MAVIKELARFVLKPGAMSGPHDLLVRYTFENPERAAAELRVALPPFAVAQVDWSSLKAERNSVVDPELRETETDLLYSARLKDGRQVLFYVLLEHQSTVVRWMALRLLKYVVRQLEHWRRQHPDSKRMPMILPVVLYHGAEGRWTAPRRVEELFDVPEEERELWLAVLPQFGYGVDDLTQQREEALRARAAPALVKLVLLVLVYGQSEQLAQRLPGWQALLEEALGGAWRRAGGDSPLSLPGEGGGQGRQRGDDGRVRIAGGRAASGGADGHVGGGVLRTRAAEGGP